LQKEDNIIYTLLKKEIAIVMKKSYPGVNSEISEWKGQTITDFQEDLLQKVNGRISEKWFYTHMKSTIQTLPRIDVLNMLSQYAGYKNWDDFRHRNLATTGLSDTLAKSNRVFIIIPLIILAILAVLFTFYKIINTQNYRFTFIDADTGEPILNTKIQAELLLNNETPVSYLSDSKGNIIIRTDQSKIRLAVSAPCYIEDTITRIVKKFNRNEQIRLKSDPYSLMIQYFSQTDVQAWQSRREQLDRIIADNAMIFRLPDRKEGSGMELYNKQEFIDKLTMPSSSLRQIEIISSRYEKNQIALLRFRNKKIGR
jgi:hypothetical protein